MFIRAFSLFTVSGLALHSALLADGCCGDDASVMSCAFEDGIQIETTSIEGVSSTSPNWDCCGKSFSGPWCFEITLQPIYWLNAHQGKPVGQVVTETPAPPSRLFPALKAPPYVSDTKVQTESPRSVVDMPLFWGWGGLAEVSGRSEGGNQFSLSLLGFYSKDEWTGSEGIMHVEMLPVNTVAPFSVSDVTKATSGVRLGQHADFSFVTIQDETWFWQGQLLSGVDAVLSSSSKIGCRFGISGLYGTWDRDGVAGLVPAAQAASVGQEQNVTFDHNNKVYAGGLTFGLASTADFWCGMSIYGKGSTTLYFAREEASRVLGNLDVLGGFTGSATTAIFPKSVNFSMPAAWRMFPMFDLGVGVEWDSDWCCFPMSIQLGWEHHIALNMFTDFVMREGVFPGLIVGFDSKDPTKNTSEAKSTLVQEYDVVYSSYILGGPTLRITTSF